MKIIAKQDNTKKRVYVKPLVERIKLDNEISMVMMSPPPDPGAYMPERNDNNPFKVEQA